MAIYKAFFDDSGSDEAAPHMIVAGYVAASADWDRLSRIWLRLLREWGVDWFHMKEAEKISGPDGARRNGYGWDWKLRDQRLAILGQVVDSFVVGAIGCATDRRMWRRYVEPHLGASRQFENELGHPYADAYTGCLAMTKVLAKSSGVGLEDVEIVFAEQKKQGPKAREAVRRILANFELRDPQFGNMHDLPPLQCADIIAWLVNRRMSAGDGFIKRSRWERFLAAPQRILLLQEAEYRAMGEGLRQAAAAGRRMRPDEFRMPDVRPTML